MQHPKISILSTRPLSPELIRMAEEKGFSIHVVPFIRTEPVFSNEVRERIQSLSRESANVVVTSMNAADAVIAQLNGVKPAWKLFSMGNTTRRTLANFLGEDAIMGTAGSARQLADMMVQKLESPKVVFFCGDQRRDELPGILHANNIAVEEVVVYRTLALSHKIHNEYRGILFFSPSAVNSFFALNSIAPDVNLFAIGETTAETIRSYCTNEIIISEEPGKEELLSGMFAYYHARTGRTVR